MTSRRTWLAGCPRSGAPPLDEVFSSAARCGSGVAQFLSSGESTRQEFPQAQDRTSCSIDRFPDTSFRDSVATTHARQCQIRAWTMRGWGPQKRALNRTSSELSPSKWSLAPQSRFRIPAGACLPGATHSNRNHRFLTRIQHCAGNDSQNVLSGAT